jgi:hypothetical protein
MFGTAEGTAGVGYRHAPGQGAGHGEFDGRRPKRVMIKSSSTRQSVNRKYRLPCEFGYTLALPYDFPWGCAKGEIGEKIDGEEAFPEP